MSSSLVLTSAQRGVASQRELWPDRQSEGGRRLSSNSKQRPRKRSPICPLCGHFFEEEGSRDGEQDNEMTDEEEQGARIFEIPNYGLPHARIAGLLQSEPSTHFESLSSSLRGSPVNTPPPSWQFEGFDDCDTKLAPESFVQGYYQRFFKEERKLGKGARGTVYLCSHVLDNIFLGQYAVKKISVGNSQKSLLASLREIKQLESLRHANIVSYHHSWLEMASTTLHAPSIPHLFVLMEFSNAGSLRDFVNLRLHQQAPASVSEERAKLKQDHRARRMSKSRPEAMRGGVHLISFDNIVALFRDVCSGLAYLHSQNVCHCDLKAENVLLHFEEDALLPTVRIADFGNAEKRDHLWQRERSGLTGTIAYLAPEALQRDSRGRLHEITAAFDLWAAGFLLHLLCFLQLPISEEADIEDIAAEIQSYPGYVNNNNSRADIPFGLHRILSGLLDRNPLKRPTANDVLRMLDRLQVDTPTGLSMVIKRSSSPLRDAGNLQLALPAVDGTINVPLRVRRKALKQFSKMENICILSAFLKIYLLSTTLGTSPIFLSLCFAEVACKRADVSVAVNVGVLAMFLISKNAKML